MIYHITTRAAWERARQEGAYRAPSLASEGFIHCSGAQQLAATAQRYFQNKAGLVLLHIDPARLEAELRLEPGTGAEQHFPHIYGPLNLDAVVQVTAFDPDQPPDLLPS